MSLTNTMCSSFSSSHRFWVLQFSRNTTLPFYLSQHSNMFDQFLHSFSLFLVLNQQAPCTHSGCLRVLFTQIISAHIKFPREIITLACAIFLTQVTRSLDDPMCQLHHYSDSVTIPVLAHRNTDLATLLISSTSGEPLHGVLFIVSTT